MKHRRLLMATIVTLVSWSAMGANNPAIHEVTVTAGSLALPDDSGCGYDHAHKTANNEFAASNGTAVCSVCGVLPNPAGVPVPASGSAAPNTTVNGVYDGKVTYDQSCAFAAGHDEKNYDFTVGRWVSDKPISLIGCSISQTSPDLKNLHYGKTGSPEISTYKLTIGPSSKDIDKDELTGVEADAGLDLDPASILWTVDPENAGELTGSGMTAEFKPGDEVKENIKITANIKEGKKYSYLCGSHDSEAPVTIDGINTFKVGIKMVTVSDDLIWEDSTAAHLHKPIGMMDFSHTISTTIPGEPGIIKHDPKFPGAAKDKYEWVTIARSESSDLTAVSGKVRFVPGIAVTGKYRTWETHEGFLPPGSGQLTVLKTVLAAVSANPYVAAAVELTAAASGTFWTHTWEGAMYGECVIQWVAEKTFKYDYTDGNANTWQDYSGLSVDGTAIEKTPASTIHGSVDMQAMICVNDDSITSGSVMHLTTVGGVGRPPGEATSVVVKCSKPEWVP